MVLAVIRSAPEAKRARPVSADSALFTLVYRPGAEGSADRPGCYVNIVTL